VCEQLLAEKKGKEGKNETKNGNSNRHKSSRSNSSAVKY